MIIATNLYKSNLKKLEIELEDVILRDVLYNDKKHYIIQLEEYRSEESIQSNIYLIVNNGKGMILDPGGPKAYKHLLADVGGIVGYNGLQYISLSHQDPDILSGLAAWLMTTKAKVLCPKAWEKFIPHLGLSSLSARRLNLVPDMGGIVKLEDAEIQMLPAHFMHSVGMIHLYDPISKILFCGDLAVSIGTEDPYVENFQDHIQYIDAFHRRYMASQSIVQTWVKMVRQLDIEVVAPQHGAIYKGKEIIEELFTWLENQECGIDLMNKEGFHIVKDVIL